MRILPLVAAADGRLRRADFDRVTKMLHWATVVLVFAQFATALALDNGAPFLLWHRSSGVLLWTVTVLRLAWRMGAAGYPAFPAGMPVWMQWAARTSEYGLYLLLLAVPVLGMAMTLARGRAFALFVWTIPAVMKRQFALFASLHDLHVAAAWALAGLVGLHAGAALFHHYVRKDDVLKSMLP